MNCQKCGCILPEGVTCCPSCGTFAETQNTNSKQQASTLNIQQQIPNNVNQMPQNISQQVLQTPPNQAQQPVAGVAQQNVQTVVPSIQQNTQIQQPMINQIKQPVTSPTQQPLFPGQGVSVQNNLNQQSQIKQNQENIEEKPKKKKGIFIILIILIILITVGLFLYPRIKEKFDKTEVASIDKMYDTTSFWIGNKDKKAAIFNIDGEQLTDFIYTEASATFVNDTAMVKNENNEYAIINSSGKEIVKFGKYEKIYDISAAYIAKKSDNKYFLYNRAGNLVKELKSEPLPFGLNASLYGTVSYLTIGIFDNNQFTIINYAGEELLSIPFVESQYTVEENGDKIMPKTNFYNDKYLIVYYNKHIYILNILTKEVIIDFDSQHYFNIAAVNEEKKEIFITSYQQFYYEGTEPIEYKLIRNNEIVYSKNNDYMINKVYYNNDIIEIHDIANKYILTDTGDKIPFKDTDNSRVLNYVDYNNYIKENENNKIELYVNNELKQVYNCDNANANAISENKYAPYGIYVLKECRDFEDKISFFETRDIIIKTDGTLLNDKVYEYIGEFDENGYLTVSEDGETGYLIDATGKKISKEFYPEYSFDASYGDKVIRQLRNTEKEKLLYIGKNKDETETLFDINGQEYITANHINKTYNKISNDVFVLLEYDDYYAVYNVTKQKEILKTKEEPDCESEYIEIDYDNKWEYYSYSTGKLFYTLEH